MKIRIYLSLAALCGLLQAATGVAQTLVSEDFTGTATTNSWYYSGGACLTASTSATTATEFTFTTSGTAGQIPGCTAIDSRSDAYNGEALVGGVNGTITSSSPDPVNNGALRFTNGCISSGCGSGGYNQFGEIVSGSTFGSAAGVQVTFKTVTYRGNSGGSGSDGADGITFFLMDGSVAPNVGSYGGSLAYTCSMTNNKYGYNGMIGGYIGLGIDEYGNFLNGTSNTLGETVNYFNGPDNTASGGTYQPNRIGMRGAGSINWTWLNANYASYYPSSLSTTSQYSAVSNTCSTGTLWDYNPAHIGTPKNLGSNYPVLDYAAIPGAYKVLSDVKIANEYSTGGLLRSNATPILYKLKITSSGLLSLSYSYNGGAYQSVLTNQNITSSNGALPSTLRFGFAGSTGGSSNIHEVLCFKAAAADTSASSAASNQTQSSRVTSSTQAYFAYYDPNDWTGRLTANAVTSDSSGNLTIATTAYWDAACVLTGVASGSTCLNTGVSGPTAAEGATNRVILTYNGTQGVPFEYNLLTSTTTMSATEQNDINYAESIAGLLLPASTINYLRGDQSLEINTLGALFFRDRDYVLGDIVDSSPVAVGQPVSPYSTTWVDKLNTSTTMPENNSVAQSYATFVTNEITRENMVYVGANDGMVHGFRAGAFNSSNQFVGPTTSGNTDDGKELLAYFPAATITGGSLSSAASSNLGANNCNSTSFTSTTAQTIRGETPADGFAIGCVQSTLDYTNYQYGHNFFVDATPGTGDLFYGTTLASASWHTWLVGGLGAGGAGIYALDITNPTATGSNPTSATFAESNAANIVIGEWNTSNITCTTDSGSNLCANSLGNTYGTPIIRRLHNGTWGVIWGNGFSSKSGDAGIFILTINPTTAAKTMYYLSTGKSGTSDGIAYVTSADLDGDHITDYVYAGDLLGNVWRFDLTSSSATSWAVSSPNGSTTPVPIFSAGSTHPITSALVVAVVNSNLTGTQVMVAFGTGQQTPLTNTTATTYVTGTQYLYAFWDWNMAHWNSISATTQFASLAATPTNQTGLSSPYTLTPSNLTTQTLTASATTGLVTIASQSICWEGTTTCTGTNTSFGWDAALPSTNEQVIFNPQLVGGAFNVNSTVPATNSLLSCSSTNNTGYTYLIQLATGGVATTTSGNTNIFINTTTYNASTSTTSTTAATTTTVGVQTNATGTSMQMTTATNQASGTILASGTSSSTSCPLGSGACTNLNSTGLTMYPSPFASVTGCASGDTYLVYTTTSAGIASARIAPSCPLTGQRTTRSVFR
jgi:type IV pilus assembly protein PilY1